MHEFGYYVTLLLVNKIAKGQIERSIVLLGSGDSYHFHKQNNLQANKYNLRFLTFLIYNS